MNPLTAIGLISDGAQILVENIEIICILMANIIGIGVLFSWCMTLNPANSKWRKNGVAVLSIGIGGFVLLSYAIIAVSRIWQKTLPVLSTGLLLLALLAIGISLLTFTKKKLSRRLSDFIVALTVIALIVLVKFAFLKQLEYPLYYDSAVHYEVVDDLQNLSEPQPGLEKVWNLKSGRYYHLGFHSTVAVLGAQLGGSYDEAQLILTTGHVFLIGIVLSVGILSSRLFNSYYAGIATIIFAGLGWSMPAYAINWGKYPAISSLAIFPLAVYWMINSWILRENNRRLPIFLSISLALCCILLHSRSLLLLACGVAAVVTLQMIWNRLSEDNIVLLVGAEFLLTLLLFRFHPNLRSALLPYLNGVDSITTIFTAALIFFVASQNTKVSLGILTFMVYVALVATIPSPEFLVRHSGPYLLDRPFLQILIFLPLSLFIGASFSYFIAELRLRLARTGNERLFVGIGLLCTAVLAIIIRPVSDFKPDSCCVYMRTDDIFLIGWIEQSLPKNSRILISTDTGISDRPVKVPTDAGAWITPLTELDTLKFDYQADLSDPELHSALCRERINYIYVSTVNRSFSITELEGNMRNYSPTLILPESRLYGVNCSRSLPMPF